MITKENLMDNEAATRIRLEIEKLISSYKVLRDSKTEKGMKDISEANVRADFIDRLFEILGWAVNNPDEYDREHFIRGAGFADVALKLESKPVIFLEAKRFGAIKHIDDRKGADWTVEERQAILYAARQKCKWAVLTNFEKFRVFNAMTGLTVLSLESVDDYKNRLWDIIHLTKEFVISDKIGKLGTREEKEPIDRQFLELLNRWRRELANDIYLNNFLNEGKPPDLSKLFPDYKKHEHDPRYRKFFESRREMLRKRLDFSALKDEKGSFDIEKLKSAVQRILDRLIIIRWAEDHLLLEDSNILYEKLKLYKATARYNPLYEALFSDGALFDRFNDIHNGEIFKRGLYYDRITVSDDVLKRIIEEMTSYSFRKFDFDILGSTYETYLGYTLYLKDDNTFDLKPSQETRKESGIYYTPPYIVDYIVKNTLGALLNDKKPEEVTRIKVLDPACGSGSFLIKAYDCFANYYEDKNREIKARIDEHVRKGMLFETSESKYEGYEASILMNNIHGVDLDAQAAEIAAVNLMLKALKPNEMLPPILGETIKVGNSLISGGEEELQKYFGEEWRAKKPFNWEEEFADVFDKALAEGERGFDVVIGNPPYERTLYLENEKEYYSKNYASAYGSYDILILFIEKAIKVLKNKGYLGFIVSNKFLVSDYGMKTREFLLSNCKIVKVIDLADAKRVFPDALVSTVIIIVQKTTDIPANYEIKRFIADMSTVVFDESKFEIVPLDKFVAQNGTFNVRYDPQKDTIYEKINRLKQFGAAFDIRTGIMGFEYWKMEPYIHDKKQNVNDIRIATNSYLDRYCFLWEKSVNLYKKSFTEPYANIEKIPINVQTKKLFLTKSKLLVRGVSQKLTAMIDDEGVGFLVAVHSIITKEYNQKLVLGLLNSKLFDWIHKDRFYLGRIPEGSLKYPVSFIKELPLPLKIDKHNEETIITFVDRMLSLNKQLNTINADFQHYLNLRPHSTAPLRNFMEALPVGDKEVLEDHKGKSVSTIDAEKFEAFDVVEEGEWLVFVVGYSYTSGKGKPLSSSNVRALRLRIPNNSMRKFILYSLKDTAPGKLGSGNILKQLQKLKLPRLVTNGEGNRRAVEELMAPFLVEVVKKEALELEIRETDDAIDKKVYALYGLTADEIRIIEEQCKK